MYLIFYAPRTVDYHANLVTLLLLAIIEDSVNAYDHRYSSFTRLVARIRGI